MTKKISCRVIKSVSLAEDISTAASFGPSGDAHSDTINNAIVLAVKVRGINDSVGGNGFTQPVSHAAIGQIIDCYA